MFSVFILHYKMKIYAPVLIRWDMNISGLELRKLRLLLLQLTFVRSYCKLKFLTNILEEYFFFENLTPLLIVADFSLFHNYYSKWPQNLKFMIFRVRCRRPTIAIETKIIVGFTCEAFKSICSNWVHQAFVASYGLVLIRLQGQLSLHMFDYFRLLFYIFT